MKLFHKFLIAILIISLVPLIIFSITLLQTTGATLRIIIDRNNLNMVGNVTREVNEFFIEIERKLDVARTIEKNPKIKINKTQTLMEEISGDPMLLGMFFLNKKMKMTDGMTANSVVDKIIFDNRLISKGQKQGHVQLSQINYNNDIPFIDVVYPMDIKPKQYLYVRVSLENLLNKIVKLLSVDSGKIYKDVYLIDEYGKIASTVKDTLREIHEEKLDQFRENEKGKTLYKGKYINIFDQSRGPGWLVQYIEPKKRAYAPINKLKIGSMVLIIVSLVLTFFGAFILTNNLVKPIRTLISGIESVAAGNFDHRVPKVSNDELNKLTNIFNNMIEELIKLQDAMKKKERLSAIGEMSNILGHEIRNPLAAITNATYLIKMELKKMGDINPKMFKRVDIIEAEIKSTNKIINDMLDFSRSRPPVLSEQDVNSLLNLILEENPVPEHLELDAQLNAVPHVNIDEEEMKQVFRNLVNNAVDSMKEKGMLSVYTYKTTEKDVAGNPVTYVVGEVKDTGCGIEKEILAKIFEPFFSTKSKGTGLGLAVVKRIVEDRHNGKLEVKSVVGRGTSFYVKLPAKH